MTMDSRAVTGRATVSEPPIGSAVERLTRATCTFAEHIDRDGVGWSSMRHDDVCAVLGEVERLQRLTGEMHEALKACRSTIDGLMGDTDPHEETPALLACQAASAAIAKADGRP